MAPPTNLAISREYSKLRSPRRISSNGWGRSSEIVLRRKADDGSNGDREVVETEVGLLMRSSWHGMLHPKICANCRTSKTPLWRSGPTGPKSLCNACGIRFRKKQLEAGEGKKPFTFFALNGDLTSPSADVMTLEEMKALQKAKQLRELRSDVERRVQERRKKLLERSRKEKAQAAHLLVMLSKGKCTA